MGSRSIVFLINVDGQAARWEVDGVKDIKPAYDVDGKTSRDPEAREGLKYILEKKGRLTVGTHSVFFGLPGDKYSTEVEISLVGRLSLHLRQIPHSVLVLAGPLLAC